MKENNIINSSQLHILAMVFMFCDHLWATVLSQMSWLTCIGRLAFPIFAFMLVEGYFNTHNLRRYMLRIFIFALISEIPFNIMCCLSIFYPFHQNTLWTLLLSLIVISIIEKAKKTNNIIIFTFTAVAASFGGFLAAFAAMVDYYGFGVLIVLSFYFFRGRKWYNFLFQFICLYILNIKFLGGFYYSLNLFGLGFEFPRQGFALLALIPIWLYNGKKGQTGKSFKYFCYMFYPCHIAFIDLLMKIS